MRIQNKFIYFALLYILICLSLKTYAQEADAKETSVKQTDSKESDTKKSSSEAVAADSQETKATDSKESTSQEASKPEGAEAPAQEEAPVDNAADAAATGADAAAAGGEAEEPIDDGKTINILTLQPGMPETLDALAWEINYENLMNKYFAELAASNPSLADMKLSFGFYEYEPVNRTTAAVYFRYLQDIFDGIEYGDYDLIIFDDRTLFNEISFMETDWIQYYFTYSQPSLEFSTDLTDATKNINFDIFDPRIIEDGKYRGKLYGLPYEMDFDVLYYKESNAKAKNLVQNMQSITWDEVVSNLLPADNLNIGLGNDHDLLNLFIEYVANHYELNKDVDPKFYEVFYNEESVNLYTSFYEFVMNYSLNDIVNGTLYLSQDEAYKNFMENKSTFFKARASDNALFQTPIKDANSNSTDAVNVSFPPKNFSTVMEKFLIVNTRSPKDKKMLTDAAILLTSKEMQLFRAEHFGTIPAFDYSKKDVDPDVQSYCKTHSDLCNIMSTVNRLYLKDVFKSEYSVPLFEIVALLPVNIKKYLKNNDIDLITFSMNNAHDLITNQLGIFGVLSYVIISVFAIAAFVVMYLVYKHKNHPYLKVISPMFCNMIILGCTMNMVKVLQHLPPYSVNKAKFSLMFETLCTNLIYIPMFAVTYRIFKIFKAKSFISRTLNNTRLFIIIVVLILLSLVYRGFIVYKEEFFYLPFGSVKDPRFPEWSYTNYEKYNGVYQTYMHGIFIALLFMIITTGQVSQKFGDICYTFVIFFLNISDFIVKRLLEKLSYENYDKYFLLIIIFNTVASALCIYTLVGSRLFLIIMYPGEIGSNGIKLVTSDNLDNLAAFVPLISRKKYFSILNKFKKLKTSFTNLTSNDSMFTKSKKDFSSNDSFAVSSSENHVISNMSSKDTSGDTLKNNSGYSNTFLGKDYKSYQDNSHTQAPFPAAGTNGFNSPPITSPIGSPNPRSPVSPRSPNRTYVSNEYYNNILNQEYNNFNQSLSRPYGRNSNDINFNNNENSNGNYKFMNFDRFNYPTNRPNKNNYQQFD